MGYLKNIWYVAAWPHELVEGPLARVLLEREIVFFRNGEGGVTAADNLCPHRFAPLHRGRVVDGQIQCPYHGLRFDGSGRCTFNPDGNGRTPAGAKLTVYPTAERWGFVWIWMGDPARADASIIPDYPFLDDPDRWQRVDGFVPVRANYRLVTDNLMDHAHLQTLHTQLGCDMIQRQRTRMERDAQGTLWVGRHGVGGDLPPAFTAVWNEMRGPIDGPMDFSAEAGWDAPATVRNANVIARHGTDEREGLRLRSAHFLTPETGTTTHYFWAVSRDFALGDAAVDAQLREAAAYAFIHEDEVMLHDIQQRLGDRDIMTMRPAFLDGDIGVVEVRRALDRMIAAEEAATSLSPLAGVLAEDRAV